LKYEVRGKNLKLQTLNRLFNTDKLIYKMIINGTAANLKIKINNKQQIKNTKRNLLSAQLKFLNFNANNGNSATNKKLATIVIATKT